MTSLEHWRGHMMEHYAHGSWDAQALEDTALRAESVHMRSIFAHAASQGTLTSEELAGHVLSGTACAYSLNPEWLARLATVCGLQNTQPDDADFATAALQLALPRLVADGEPTLPAVKLLAELLFDQRRFSELDALLARNRELRRLYYGYLRFDAGSPFVRSDLGPGAEREWLDGFNRQFTDRNLLEVRLRPGDEAPLNRLEAASPPDVVDEGPLVTVIMTSFEPVREDVLQSARSILAQSWRRLELLVVDDASPAEFSPVLDELDALDSRVRGIRLETNRGTYTARNVGIAEARGDFITGQDADDWSHPQRIEAQVRQLLDDPGCPGNQTYTVNMTEDLVRIRRGYPPFIPGAPSLMVRSHLMRELGGYLPARKAADNELRGRIAAYTGRPVELVKEPLIFMRILPGSLSRDDFRPGWQHPARRAFRSAYKTWHAHATADELRLQHYTGMPIDVPSRLTAPPGETQHLDVVLAADWCEFGTIQAQMLEEIHVLFQAGRSVGILHLDNAVHLSGTARQLCRPIQELISAGELTSVLADEDFHQVGLMLVRTPELLQFMPQGAFASAVDRVLVAAENPSVSDDGRVTYLPQDCAAHSEVFFGRRPLWAPGTAGAREQLRSILPEGELSSLDYGSPFAAERWRANRPGRRRQPVVLGAWAGTLRSDWPAKPAQLCSLLPVDGSVDVRLYGDPGALVEVLGEERLPASWLCFPQRSIFRRTYYRSLDFFLHFPRTTTPARHRGVLEALAAGCVVILPPGLQKVYGDAAVYAEPVEVPGVIGAYTRDPELYRQQSQRAAAFGAGAGFSASAYGGLIRQFVAERSTENQEILAG